MKPDTSKTIPRNDLQRSPADAFRFCPHCGGESLAVEEQRAIKCGICGFLFFFNSATAAGAFIFHQHQLILGIRGQDPCKGMLDLPGGFIEYDETVEEGLQREITEELGIETRNFRYLTSVPNDYLYAGVLYKVTDLFFICEAPEISEMQASDDVADFLIIAPEEIDPEQLAFRSSRMALEKLKIWLKRA
jgi:ADP-ribose pyrophosphatase YjhB (NUDIX family)/ribosomal protein S27AE